VKGAIENIICLYREFSPEKKNLPNCLQLVANARELINNPPKNV